MLALDLTAAPPRSPYAEVAGLLFLARTIDKARALLPGGDPGDYTLDGISARLFAHAGIEADAFVACVARAETDAEVAAWLAERAPAERLADWNAVVLDRRVGDHNRERMAARYPVFRRQPELTRIIDILVADDRATFSKGQDAVANTQREFMTSWHSSVRPPIEAWSMRTKEGLMESGTSSHRVPPFRAFDLLAGPNQALVLLANDDHRIGVESVCGAQTGFRRNVDFDTVYFQFCGTTSIESEYGDVEMRPGDLVLIPEGIAHRSTGSADSLRWFAHAHEPFATCMTEADELSRTEFVVRRRGGPQWMIASGRERPVRGGRVEERMVRWDDGPDDFTIIERDYETLAGVSSTAFRERSSGIRKLRAFDTFRDVAGTSGEPPALLQGPKLEARVYNIIGEQFAFHRALRSEEVRIQFRGDALDMSELQNVACRPGTVTVVPRGIAHSVVTDPPESDQFLRLNFYSFLPWRYPHDLTRHHFESTFEIETTVVREAPWKQQTAGAAATAGP